MQAIPFLMFQGQARDAMALWQKVIPGFEVISVAHYPEGEMTGGMAGQVMNAEVRIGTREWRLYDSPPVHDFTFTPATSIFVDCDDEAQLRAMANGLGEGGAFLMPIDTYGFSTLFCWVADRFGVSWQLNLA